MYGTAALRRDFIPGLNRVLGSIEPKQLERRLRDRIELDRLRKETDNDLAELKDAVTWLEERSEQPAPDDADPDWLTEAANKASEKEREAAAHFYPVIAALKSALEPPDDKFEADVQELIRDGIEVLEGWLAFYHGLHALLTKQVSEQRTPRKILRARPVEGPIHHEALSREFMARFPKIRAALAR